MLSWIAGIGYVALVYHGAATLSPAVLEAFMAFMGFEMYTREETYLRAAAFFSTGLQVGCTGL